MGIVDDQGKLIGRFGKTPVGTELGKFLAPHVLAVDSRDDGYVGEVSWTGWPPAFPDTPHRYVSAAYRNSKRLRKEGDHARGLV